MNGASPEQRRQAVARLLRHARIGTQEALLSALRREGFRATQATLSRDLARLGARRVLRPGGGAVYELAEEGADAGLSALRGLALSVTANGSLVVVRTRVGSAPAVARAVDLARLEGVLGTIAGDDTIFVAPSRERGARALASRLGSLLAAPVVPAVGGAARSPP
ncbi:MAG TPA: arginine repressor [Anaeromyxobacteraceae bacterium]|nr:arginine repressor [Anaeromyxobacteraceae bacterium]